MPKASTGGQEGSLSSASCINGSFHRQLFAAAGETLLPFNRSSRDIVSGNLARVLEGIGAWGTAFATCNVAEELIVGSSALSPVVAVSQASLSS